MKSIHLLTLLAFSSFSLFAGDGTEPRKAPELAFYLPGQGQKLLSQYRGKVVALEFILTTCPHCQAAAKVMSKFQSEFGPKGLQVIDVAINAYDNGGTDETAPGLVQAFAIQHGADFPVGWVKRDAMTSFMNFSIMDRTVVPQLALIDRKGFIRYQTPATSGDAWEKVMNETALRAHIEELLAQPTAASKGTHVASAKNHS
jgi:thiol-disulfide isomerase/thioredoxin